MKFNKAFLFATLVASAVTLTACNDKEQKPAAPEAPKTEQAAPKADAAPAPKAEQTAPQAEQKAAPASSDANLKAFNQAVKISPVSREIVENTQKIPGIAVSYKIENISDKAITSIHWVSAYTANEKVIYLVDIPVKFEKPVAPKATETVTETTFAPSIPEATRAIALDPNVTVSPLYMAYEIDFADGSKIVVEQPPVKK